MSADTDALTALESRMDKAHIRGQWQVGVNRPENARHSPDGKVWIDPVAKAHAHAWRWRDMEPILEGACTALPESATARRSLIYMNPGLPMGTTQTITAGIQIIQPGEIAWAHRHSVNALRFTIQGGDDVFTVVDGEVLPMGQYDLILTPGWCWHDHHNQTSRPAMWLDVLDVPFIAGLNQNYYEELGETMQDRRNDTAALSTPLLRPTGEAGAEARPSCRYAWADVVKRLDVLAGDAPHRVDGVALAYTNPATGGSTLPTLTCTARMLPPGFSGRRIRTGCSTVHFVVGGEGRIDLDENSIAFTKHDGIAVPNWTWHRLVNTSASEPAYLFSVSDRPILDAFGLYREQLDDTNS
jgi:1-hydroxy-2-naphthoate dioxygenase